MIARIDSCSCSTCGVVCTGRFVACKTVWADGPKVVSPRRVQCDGAEPPVARAVDPLGIPATEGAPPELQRFLESIGRKLERMEALVRELGLAHDEMRSRLSLLATYDDDDRSVAP